MKIRDKFQLNRAAASDYIASRSSYQFTGNVIPLNAAARGGSVRKSLSADHLQVPKLAPASIQKREPWSEADCRLFVSALSKLKQKEACSLVLRVLL